MKSRTRFIAGTTLGEMIGLGVFSLQILFIAAPLDAQDRTQSISSEIRRIGTAEMRSVTKTSGFFPDKQPVVYWHDEDWKIDLTPQSSPNAFSLSITSSDGREKIVKLPNEYSQIDSISRTPNNNVMVIADVNGMTQAFCIIDLKREKIIDGSILFDPTVSPDLRFLLYKDWYLPHVGGENLYSLYDTLKTPDENTCGYGENNPEYKKNSGALQVIQVYPYQVSCLEAEDDSDDNRNVSDFIWSSDSSKVVFADVKSGVISLILVKMQRDDRDRDHDSDHDRDHDGDHDRDHRGDNDRPRTFIYSFVGTENVCAGAATCDSNNVRSIAWNGDSVNVALIQANPSGPAIVLNLTIPLSKFVPLTK